MSKSNYVDSLSAMVRAPIETQDAGSIPALTKISFDETYMCGVFVISGFTNTTEKRLKLFLISLHQ